MTQYERDFERVSATVRKEVIRFEVLASHRAGSIQNCRSASLTSVSMQSQKEKAKNFKSQIIKYLESLLQSQHQVSQTQKSWSARRHVQNSENNSRLGISCSWLQLTLRVPDNPSIPNLFSLFPPADQILGGFLT